MCNIWVDFVWFTMRLETEGWTTSGISYHLCEWNFGIPWISAIFVESFKNRLSFIRIFKISCKSPSKYFHDHWNISTFIRIIFQKFRIYWILCQKLNLLFQDVKFSFFWGERKVFFRIELHCRWWQFLTIQCRLLDWCWYVINGDYSVPRRQIMNNHDNHNIFNIFRYFW